MLQPILVCEQDPCNQPYLLVLQRRQFQLFVAVGGLRVFLGMGGFVLLLLMAIVATC